MTPPPTAYYADQRVTLWHGDCLDLLREDTLGYDYRLGYAPPRIPDGTFDAICTDPPYGLEFMGKEWDTFGRDTGPGYREAPRLTDRPDSGMGGYRQRPNYYQAGKAYGAWCEQWAAECLRVLKPGGHLLAFGGTRTWHRLTCAVEDAGFEIRDTIASGSAMLVWCYGSGFPKSRNVSADPLACQCLPDVRDAATTEAAESAAQVLLSDLRGRSETPGADLSHLHGLPADLRAADPLSGDSEQDLLPGVRPCPAVTDHDGQTLAPVPANGRGCLCSLREDVPAEALSAQGETGVLLPVVSSEGPCAGADRAQVRCDRHDEAAPLWRGEPGVEGRGYVQAAEGQLPRAEVRTLPAGPASDGPLGRVRNGAPAGHGPLDRSTAAAVRGGQSHQPRPEGQRQGEPGAVPVERGPQAWRGWPLCDRCGKPALPRGLGTALKPAFEPVVVARKPLAGIVAHNVTTYGTGALNIDGCRVDGAVPQVTQGMSAAPSSYSGPRSEPRLSQPHTAGRWPSNVVLTHAQADDGGDACADGCVPGCPVAELDAQSGTLTSGANPTRRGVDGDRNAYGAFSGQEQAIAYRGQESGGASRFFPTFRYEAKAGGGERPRVWDPIEERWIAHPTVKPLALIRWLARLITPPGGLILDPFAGTGTLGEAAILEGFRVVLIEKGGPDVDLDLIVHRITKRTDPVRHLTDRAKRGEDVDLGLFALLDGEA